MGREQDLLEAGRTGNIAVIEKILNLKQKKSGALGHLLTGAFDSLRRPVNPNCQDANGDTALHLAALNGHRQAVSSLLHFETSSNIIDNKGCQPLHLAAWNGHAHICTDLLTIGPSFANVDEQNHDGETALLCAAQYGHTEVINVLLQSNGDCAIRNHRGESPLDLACQYGRLETVRLLLDKQPQLVNEITENISPLHLASRNGHRAIVQLLIDRGFDINTKTETGSALHEAALCGKEDVVLFLLEQGIDVYLQDSNGRSAVEVLSDHKSQKSLHIGNAILAHLERLGLSPTKPRPASSLSYLDNDSRPVSVSDIYTTPQKILRDKSHSSRDRLESESSTTSSQLEYPPIPEYRTSRPVSDPIYDVPQPHVIPIPKGKSPALSEGSLNSPHGSPSSLGSSPGRSPTIKHEKPKKPPRRNITSRTPASIKKAAIFPPSPDASDSGQTANKGSKIIKPNFLDVKPKVIHANVPNVEEDDSSEIHSQRSNLITEPEDSGEYVSLASIAELTRSTKQAKIEESSSGKFHRSEPLQEVATKCEGQTSGNFQGISRKIDSSEDLDDKHPVFSQSDTSSTDKTSNMKDTAGNKETDTEMESAIDKLVVTTNSTQSDASNLNQNRSISSSQEVVDNMKQSLKIEIRRDIQENNNNNNVAYGGAVGKDKIDNANSEMLLEENKCAQKSGSTTPSTRPSSLEFSSKRSSLEVTCVPDSGVTGAAPLSPTGYQQPPTPDHPPPSPMTALQGIQAKFHPLEKRRSRDMETITEIEYLADLKDDDKVTVADSQTETDAPEDVDPGQSEGVVMRRKSEKLDTEEILTNGNDPFLGLTKGAIPFGERRVKSQIYENVIIHPIAKLKKRLSTPGASMSFDPSTFDPVLEKDELLQRSGEGLESAETSANVNDNMQTKSGTIVSNSSESNNTQNSNTTDKQSSDCENVTKNQNSENMGVNNNGENIAQDLENQGSNTECDKQEVNKQEVLVTPGREKERTESCDKKSDDVPRRESYKKRLKSDRVDDVMMSSMEENEEWAQISDLIKSAGGRMSMAAWQDYEFYEKQLQQLFAKDKVDGVGEMKSVYVFMKIMQCLKQNLTGIADIMASFGGTITRESVFVKDYEAQFTKMISDGSTSMQSVGDWLDCLELSQYENTFIANGYDDMEFMGPNVLEYTDLVELGVTDETHVKNILAAASTIPAVKYIGDDPTPQSVQLWLDSLHLPEYVQTFRMNGFNTVDRVLHVWELELNSVLDIATYGHRKRILASLRNPYTPRSSLDSTQHAQEVDDLTNNTSSSSLNRVPSHDNTEAPLFKDYTKSRTSHTLPSNKKISVNIQKNLQRSQSENDTVFEENNALDIRPPNTSQVRNWKHRPEVLIKGCCNYNAQYLGSTLVKNLVGLESTKESISRMKKSTAGIAKIPTILLSISYKGVKFIDAKSKLLKNSEDMELAHSLRNCMNVICEHEIGNIFCACQDGDNLNYFAYITKDLQASKLYCHVFCVKNTDLATEIILTLGEAFEVAYQMALRDQRLQSQSSKQETEQTGSEDNKLQQTLSAESDV